MPVAKLFVEGNLEVELLNPILKGFPALQIGGSKNALKPRALTDRTDNRILAGYLRDRDFDHDPLDNGLFCIVDCEHENVPIGWRWSRHEIENYLLEPVLVSEAMSWPLMQVDDMIFQAARKIRFYEAARWTVGVVRRVLPPHYELHTRPAYLKEMAIPPDLSFSTVKAWALENIDAHRHRIAKKMAPEQLPALYEGFATRFSEDVVSDPARILLWFSGKDIISGMGEHLRSVANMQPREFRNRLRDWVILNPDRTLELLPEWSALVRVVRGER